MSNLVVILNVAVVLGLVVSAILAAELDNLLSAVIALAVTGLFAAAEFLILHAPDVAISEAAVGAALAPLIMIVTLPSTSCSRIPKPMMILRQTAPQLPLCSRILQRAIPSMMSLPLCLTSVDMIPWAKHLF